MKTLYRMLEDGETIWQGRAHEAAEAEERAFYDEPPGSLCAYTLQRWGKVKISSSMTDDGWVTIYENWKPER